MSKESRNLKIEVGTKRKILIREFPVVNGVLTVSDVKKSPETHGES